MYKLLFFFLLFLNSCYFGNSVHVNSISSFNLPSVGESFAPSNSKYFYIDLDVDEYESSGELVPFYEISTHEEYGDAAERNSPSNCEILLEDSFEDELLKNSSETLLCILDVLEYDIHVKDLFVNFNVPLGMCDYVRTAFPWHFNANILPGPVVEENPCPEDAGDGCETTYTNIRYNSDLHTELREAGGKETRENQEDLCPETKLNNEVNIQCCFGGSKASEGDEEGEEWKPDDLCFGGPALTATGESVPIFYKRLVQRIPEEGFNQSFTLPTQINQTDKNISIYHANYLKELDKPLEELYDTIQNRDSLPVFLQEDEHYNKGIPRTHFEFDCVDSAGEILHSIKLMIREWNTFEEFIDFYESGGNDQADPDVTGVEGDDCDYEDRLNTASTRRGEQCNDLCDLDDYFEEIRGCKTNGGYPSVDRSSSEE
ncbi:MAG: hypothetical protein GDA46_06295 [Bdellovibrionales bacterium]|nr:hypothetical protein [Bdellovibrionales bacterium]